MPCCGVPAIPKTSLRGTFFFAHARRGECSTADESPEHLYCKSIIAKAALDAGWQVTTERPGVSPSGEEWIADVFCEKGNAKVALEVQISPQTGAETERRQKRYKESGVRCAWFFGSKARRNDVPFDRETPAFGLNPIIVGEPPKMAMFDVSLPEFVTALLQKRVAWTVPTYSRPHLVEYMDDICWACKKPIKQVLDCLCSDSKELVPDDYYEGRWTIPAYTPPSISNTLEEVSGSISNEALAEAGLNLIGRHDTQNGKPTRFPYCNLCLHCRAPQNNFFLSERIHAKSDTNDIFVDVPRFGIALIPREIIGSGTWALQQPGHPNN